MRSSAGGLRRFRDELRMQEYMWGVREWSGLVLSGKDGSGGGSECHVTTIPEGSGVLSLDMFTSCLISTVRFASRFPVMPCLLTN